MMEVRLRPSGEETVPSPAPPPLYTLLLLGALRLAPGGDVVRTAHPESARVPVSPEPSGDGLWLSMALLTLGLDPWSLLGLFLLQLFLLPASPTAAGGQGPLPRVKYCAGKYLMARKSGDCRTELEGRGGRRGCSEEGGRK